MNTNNKVYEELDITNEVGVSTYFESQGEWTEFHNRIQEYFENLEKRGCKNINFNITSDTYTEYDDSYTGVRYVITMKKN